MGTTKKAGKKVGKKAPAKKATRRTQAQIAKEKAENFTAERIGTSLTEALLNEIKALDNPWHKTPEAMQKVAIARLSDAVRDSVETAVKILSAQGHKAVVANLVSVTFKDGVRGIVSIGPGSNSRFELADHATKDVVLVLTDSDSFMKDMSKLKADADQPDLL